MERDICDDYTELADAVDRLIAYIVSTDEGGASEGYVDSGEVLDLVADLREIRNLHEGRG